LADGRGSRNGAHNATFRGTSGDYVLWGCVGAWYSGDWYSNGALGYLARVEHNLASKTWLHLGP
jgi:hypothetical protein